MPLVDVNDNPWFSAGPTDDTGDDLTLDNVDVGWTLGAESYASTVAPEVDEVLANAAIGPKFHNDGFRWWLHLILLLVKFYLTHEEGINHYLTVDQKAVMLTVVGMKPDLLGGNSPGPN